MRKKLLSILLVSMIAGTLTSCASTVAITDQQSDLAAEYISSIILKYSQKETSSKLVKLDEEEENPSQNSSTSTVITEGTNKVDQLETNSKLEEEVASKNKVALESLYGVSDVSITYKDVKECKSYPEAIEESITASNGHKFLVVSFMLKNKTEHDVTIDLLKSHVTFSLKANNSEYFSAAHTLLSDDMTYYQGKIKSNKSNQAVVLFEVKDSFQLSDAVFYAFSDDNKACEVRIK